MTYPIIHLNGDRAETLRENYVEAYRAVCSARDALSLCRPNGRNYYPVEGALDRAIQEHNARQEKLQALADEFMDLATYCDRYVKTH